MFRVLISLCIIGASLADSVPIPEGRIVGGAIANFPYAVSLRSAANAHFCGGWVHNNRWAVSAARCTIGRTESNTKVVVGSGTHRQERLLIAIKNHPNYNPITNENDISLLKLEAELQWDDYVQAIPIATTNPSPGSAVTVTCLSQTSVGGSPAETLLSSVYYVTSNLICSLLCTNKTPDKNCAVYLFGGQSACQGEPGNPVVNKNQVVGIVSNIDGCGALQGYTNVLNFISFINEGTESVI